MVQAVIIRHPREKLAKCSLRSLEGRPDLTFYKAGKHFRFDASGYVLLTLNAPPLSPRDAGRPLLLLDSTWRLLPELESCLKGSPRRRRLPGDIPTAYPRASKICRDPDGGLASVEALYLAKRLMGENDPTLLDHYHWKKPFLEGLSQSLRKS